MIGVAPLAPPSLLSQDRPTRLLRARCATLSDKLGRCFDLMVEEGDHSVLLRVHEVVLREDPRRTHGDSDLELPYVGILAHLGYFVLRAAHRLIDGIPMGRNLAKSPAGYQRGSFESRRYLVDLHEAPLERVNLRSDSAQLLGDQL
jgi:hypothetical protein